MTRTIVLSDVHGCDVELMKLFGTFNYDAAGDTIINLGDLSDKGPESGRVAKFFYDLQRRYSVVVINSNHDAKHVRYHNHELKNKETGKKNPIRTHEDFLIARRQLLELDFDAFEWMSRFPYHHRINDKVFVHAGVLPDHRPEDMYDKKLMLYIRNVRDGHMLHINDIKPEDPFWAELHAGPDFVYFGHSPQFNDLGYAKFPSALALDGGCAMGGQLIAHCIETGEFWSVKPEKQYAPRFPYGE